VKILEILKAPIFDFPQPMGTLTIAFDQNAATYKYIDDWYNKTKKCLENCL
jgi:hypothetical protein